MIGIVRFRRSALPVATVLAVATVAGCSSGPDQPETIADAFAAAVDAGDAQTAAALTTDPVAAEAVLSGLFEGLGTDPIVTVAGTGDGDTFDLDVAWEFGDDRTWRYRTSGTATERPASDDDGWRVDWDPGVLAPGLTDGESLRFTPTTGSPPTIFDAAGGTLMSEQVVTLVNVDAGADAAAVASLLAGPAPSITTESITSGVAAGAGEPVTVVALRESDLAPIEDALTALDGVTLVPQRRLLIDDRALASPVWSGLEQLWQEGQAASAGWAVQEVAADGTVTTVAGADAVDAPDLHTTVDPDLQSRAEAALASLDTPAAIVGIDASTGAIRAVAQNSAADAQGPIALTGLYPPGSTFKTVTTSAVLQAGAAAPDTVLPCPGVATIGDRTIPNDESFDLGEVPLHTAFAQSCNTTMAQLAVDLPAGALTDAALQFGLGVDYVTPGLVTVTGSVPPAESTAQRVEESIGQGQVTASPFGMALVAASIVAEGTPAPTIVEGRPATADIDVAPVPADTADRLRTMMRETVTGGTANAVADIPDLIGKTGTAEYAGTSDASGDSAGAHGWFIGAQDNLAFAVFVEGAGASAPAVLAAGRWLRG
ncbi:MAG: penicillin-binding protein [Rhodococcus sp.]|uniref:penicillin-binding transpeptidase domain-containing protein n=1 Tax=Rhodococcus TaxID=1827 RepID=UPI0016A37A83|nr:MULTISPECIES: penicillin-binding transpeptidase domain-containing protein [Rhodococcus]NLV78368.1 penicillin-binding protein [Rhodococcus sp. (in: high G+C Gram-positive bacteria)]